MIQAHGREISPQMGSCGNILSNSIGPLTGTGEVTNNGGFSATFGTTSSGADFSGTLTGSSGLGIWQNGSDQGVWEGFKQ